jgi:thymidylate kinase
MKNIIISIAQDNTSEILYQNLDYETESKLFCIQNYEELLSRISKTKDINLVILSDAYLDTQQAVASLKKLNPRPKIQVYSDRIENVQSPDMEFFPQSDFELEKLIKNALATLDPEGLKNRTEIPDYVPFSIKYFYNINSFMSDIYIKLKKRGIEEFVKRINANEEIDRETLEKYEVSGLEFLYIRKPYRFHFINQAVNESIGGLKKAHLSELAQQLDEEEHPLQVKTILNAADDTYQLSAEMLLNMGITENTIKITKASIASMKKTLKNMDTITALLDRLLKEKLSYAYKRTHITTMFAVEVLKRIDWFSKEQLPQLIEQLVYASFLHDILLTDEKLLRIHSKLNLYQADLSEQEKKLVLNHANMTSTLIQKYPKAPNHVDVIIKQHHGTSNGIGFSVNLNASLPKLVIILMVAERLVMKLLDFKKGEDRLEQVFNDLEEEFNLPTYKKVTDCLKESIISAARSK